MLVRHNPLIAASTVRARTCNRAQWQKKCKRPRLMIKVAASLLFVLLFATACSTSRVVWFNEQEQADLVVRYYTDDTSYLLKPVKMNGPFLAVLNKDTVLDLAKQQPGRDLAVVILVHYVTADETEAVKHDWMRRLKEVGYQRVVFLRASSDMRINGLPVMASGR